MRGVLEQRMCEVPWDGYLSVCTCELMSEWLFRSTRARVETRARCEYHSPSPWFVVGLLGCRSAQRLYGAVVKGWRKDFRRSLEAIAVA